MKPILLWLLAFGLATSTIRAADPDWRALVASGQLVPVYQYDRRIVVELRYATARNCVGAAIYPADFPCLTRPETAVRLGLANRYLHEWGYRLKIWDAYRPPSAQALLYQRAYRRGFLADPRRGPGSLHTWGLAVDATLVDLLGREVSMPSGFDEFAPQAAAFYEGTNPRAVFHRQLLQSAMSRGGFLGLTTEWWHFTVKDWASRQPLAPPGPAPASRRGPPPPASRPRTATRLP